MRRSSLYVLTALVTCLSAAEATAQTRLSKQDYIEKYKKIAVEEMKRSGIPASITLAQGILESDCGNSTLARKANNHFGIKCHKWDGKKHYHDDDAKNECFRKYDSVEESYYDRTDFLMKTPRYRFLFDYPSDDYKSWANGLQQAGYATSKTYARDLIRIIEENKLYVFDSGDYTRQVNLSRRDSDESFVIAPKKRRIYERNRIKYIVVQQGDNLVSLTKEMGLFKWELKRYNDLPDGYEICPGEELYIQPKRSRPEAGYDFHYVKKGETMRSISQLYGVKLKKLYHRNRMEPGTEPIEGQKIWLRKTMPRSEWEKLNTSDGK